MTTKFGTIFTFHVSYLFHTLFLVWKLILNSGSNFILLNWTQHALHVPTLKNTEMQILDDDQSFHEMNALCLTGTSFTSTAAIEELLRQCAFPR